VAVPGLRVWRSPDCVQRGGCGVARTVCSGGCGVARAVFAALGVALPGLCGLCAAVGVA
jgi:hypothetical protein